MTREMLVVTGDFRVKFGDGSAAEVISGTSGIIPSTELAHTKHSLNHWPRAAWPTLDMIDLAGAEARDNIAAFTAPRTPSIAS